MCCERELAADAASHADSACIDAEHVMQVLAIILVLALVNTPCQFCCFVLPYHPAVLSYGIRPGVLLLLSAHVQVIACTLTGVVHPQLDGQAFDVAVVDEAAQVRNDSVEISLQGNPIVNTQGWIVEKVLVILPLLTFIRVVLQTCVYPGNCQCSNTLCMTVVDECYRSRLNDCQS